MREILRSSCMAAVVCGVSIALGCGGGGGDGGSSQIDRMGRAGVNTAVTDPFYRESVAAEQVRHDQNADDYNASRDRDDWVGEFAPALEPNLAILDSLDTVCGNQLLAGPAVAPGRYRGLAEVLADDALWVNSQSGSCAQYLAVEGNAIGITNGDCGGRTPLHDTIDVTYSALAAGALAGVTDGIAKDGDGTASLDAFPFLAAPN
ncbi:MAG: hypothetical protein ACREQJ_08990 [Candidatus Binatia bacterium]